MFEAVVTVLLFGVQNAVLDEDGDGPQDEGHKQVHVDEVPGAVELPEAWKGGGVVWRGGESRERGRERYHSFACVLNTNDTNKQLHFNICSGPTFSYLV